MRLRNVKGAKEKIEKDEHVVHDALEWKGRWQEFFENDHPIYLEIGTGKGKFLLEMADRYPQYNFIGVERYASVLIRAVEKLEICERKNLTLICMDAQDICEIFAENEIAGIYLNFSDPWPKDRHAKRRLTSDRFWKRYDQFLQPQGRVAFKTDNLPLFEFSLQQAQAEGWELEEVTYDFHQSPYVAGNITTEYEEKFAAEGKPIYHLKAYRQKKEKPGRLS